MQTSTPVRSVQRVTGGVDVRADDDSAEHFDAAVIATHPHQAWRCSHAPTGLERDLLGRDRATRINPTLLHTDLSVLPSARAARRRRGTTAWIPARYVPARCRSATT